MSPGGRPLPPLWKKASLIDSQRRAERRVGYHQVISHEIEKDNCIIL